MNIKMKKYSIESVLWNDHTHVHRGQIPENPDTFIIPTLSVGIILKETKKTITLISEIERYDDRDDSSFTIIFKNAILGRRKYGSIKLDNIKS